MTGRPDSPAPARAAALSPVSRRVWPVLAVAAAAAALFVTYLSLSRTVPANSDGASIALQAWAMLHGNLLLHGWVLSDVAFYTTELPQYMLIEAVHGLRPGDTHIAGAMTYTILVLLTAALARGRARGRRGLIRAVLAAGIMIAPPLGSVYVLMLEPDHVGSVVPVLLLALVVDRADQARRAGHAGRRWLVPALAGLAGLIAAWALVADQVILVTAVLPLIIVAAIRGYRTLLPARRHGTVTDQGAATSQGAASSQAGEALPAGPALQASGTDQPDQASQRAGGAGHETAAHAPAGGSVRLPWLTGGPVRLPWLEAGLVAAGLAAAALGAGALRLIHAAGGFFVHPVNRHLATFGQLPHNAVVTLQSVLVLFGVNFTGHRAGILAGIGLLHLVGLGLVVWAVCSALRRFARLSMGMQLAAVAVLATFFAYLLGPNALTGQSAREMAAVLPLGAALAGRLLAGRLRRVRLLPALAGVLAVSLAGLGYYATRPPAPSQGQALAGWLARHDLRSGLTTDYWVANSTTLDSRGTLAVRTIQQAGPRGQQLKPNLWEINYGWYAPRRHRADFVVLSEPGRWPHQAGAGALLHSFGRPRRVYHPDGYTVLVWDSNLLKRLAR